MNDGQPHGSPNEAPIVDAFAARLRRIGDAIPLADDELGVTTVRRNLGIRRRQHRIVALTAAAAVGVAAVTAGAIGLSNTNDTLTVATAPTRSDVPSTTSGDRPSTSASETAAEVIASSSAVETANDPDSNDSPVDGIGRDAIVATVADVLAPPITEVQPVDVTEFVPITDQTPPPIWTEGAAFSDTFDWLVVRGEEFLLGNIRVSGAPDPVNIELYSSTDGRTWTEVDVQVPANFGSANDVAATNDRLVVLAERGDGGRSQTVVWETTDFTNWTAHPIDPPNPAEGFPDGAPVTGRSVGYDVAANDEAWAVHVSSDLSLDLQDLVDRRLDREVASYGSSSSFGPYIDVRIYGDDADGAQNEVIDEFRVDFVDDLGLTQAQAERLGRGVENEMWVGDWTNAAPRRVDDLPPGSFAGVSATDDAVIGWTASQIGVLRNGDDTIRSFALPPALAGRSSLFDVYPDGSDLVVLSGHPDGSSSFDVLSIDDSSDAATWTPLDLSPLPSTVLDGYRSTDEAATVLDTNVFPGAIATTSNVEVDGLRFTEIYDPPFSSYEVVDIATGEVIATETIDSRTQADPRVGGYRYRLSAPDDGFEIVDPETGEPVITLTRDAWISLFENRTTLDGAPVNVTTPADFNVRDTWLAAVDDGRWFVHDLAEPGTDEFGNPRFPVPGLVAANSSTALVQTADGWELFELG